MSLKLTVILFELMDAMQNSPSELSINKPDFSRNVYSILGLPFDAFNLQQAQEAILYAIDNKQRCFLTTPNLNFLIAAQEDDAFYQSVIDSDISSADGMSVVWLAKLLGIPLKGRVAGSDLFAELSQLKQREKKISVFFFGGQAGIAEQASLQLNQNSKSMICCGYHAPGFGTVDEMSADAIIQEINQANPDFLVVALGAEKGQAWIQKNKHRLNASVISHLGAVINFVAGHVERAPICWQQMGFEWLWRIKQEPSLWRRYFFDSLVLTNLMLTKVMPLAVYDRYLKRSMAYSIPMEVVLGDSTEQLVHLSGSLKSTGLGELKCVFNKVLSSEDKVVVLDFSKVTYLGAEFIAQLVLLQNKLLEQGRELALEGISKRSKYLLELNLVWNRFV